MIRIFASLMTILFSINCMAINQPAFFTISEQPFLIVAVVNTEEGKTRDVDTLWKEGGQTTNTDGNSVIWGYFYVNPDHVDWGNINNPELFVKIWIDQNGRIDVNYIHVSALDIVVMTRSVFSNNNDYPLTVVTTQNRYVQHRLDIGTSQFKEVMDE